MEPSKKITPQVKSAGSRIEWMKMLTCKGNFERKKSSRELQNKRKQMFANRASLRSVQCDYEDSYIEVFYDRKDESFDTSLATIELRCQRRLLQESLCE